MNVQQAYDSWASQYDTNYNRTRDREAVALRETLAGISFSDCLEIGCGTGKNTQWLLTKAESITAVDLSEEMLAKAKEKITSDKVQFIQANILNDWTFTAKPYDLITFSLVLEHIENLESVFEKASSALQKDGHVYIGELHPFKQYTGSKARFETKEGLHIVPCFNHHISDFIQAGEKYGLQLESLNEYFDEEDRSGMPRLLVLLLKKSEA